MCIYVYIYELYIRVWYMMYRPVMRKKGLGSAGSNGTTKSSTHNYCLYLYSYIHMCICVYIYELYIHVYLYMHVMCIGFTVR